MANKPEIRAFFAAMEAKEKGEKDHSTAARTKGTTRVPASEVWGKRPSKKAGSGRRSQEVGAKFEEFILKQAQMELSGRVVLHQTQPMYARIGGKWSPVGKGWLDFSGAIEGGRSVNFDAKATEGATWSMDPKLFGHQGEKLRQAARLGAVAFVFLHYSHPIWVQKNAYYVLPWSPEGPIFTQKYDSGQHKGQWMKTRRFVDLEKWKIPPGRTWLDAALQWERYCLTGWSGLEEPRP